MRSENTPFEVILVRVALLLGLWAVLAQVAHCQVTTTVADTVHTPTGATPSGTITVTANSTFTAADTTPVYMGSKSIVTVTSGVFTVNLIPNSGSNPSGTSYTALYNLGGYYFSEIWVVPVSGSPVNLNSVRSSSKTFPVEMIAASQISAPSSCTAANQGWLWNGTNFLCANIPQTGAAGGDLSGNFPNPTVAKINGAAVPSSKTIVGTDSSSQIVDASSATLANNTTGQAGSVVGPVTDNGGQVFNAKARGATGNGSTNDATSIQNTINAAGVNGCTLLTAGTYLTTGTTLTLATQQCVLGAGSKLTIVKNLTGPCFAAGSAADYDVRMEGITCLGPTGATSTWSGFNFTSFQNGRFNDLVTEYDQTAFLFANAVSQNVEYFNTSTNLQGIDTQTCVLLDSTNNLVNANRFYGLHCNTVAGTWNSGGGEKGVNINAGGVGNFFENSHIALGGSSDTSLKISGSDNVFQNTYDEGQPTLDVDATAAGNSNYVIGIRRDGASALAFNDSGSLLYQTDYCSATYNGSLTLNSTANSPCTRLTPPGGTFSGTLVGNVTGALTGNASTATALASTPAQCSGSNYSTGVTANGTANCAQVAYSQVSGTPSALPPSGSAGGDLSGTFPNPGVAKVNGGSVPASANVAGTNSSNQIVSATANQVSSGLNGFTNSLQAGASSTLDLATNSAVFKSISVQPVTDGTTAWRLFAQNGTTAVVDADTTNDQVGIDKVPTTALDVSGTIQGTQLQSTGGGNSGVAVQSSGATAPSGLANNIVYAGINNTTPCALINVTSTTCTNLVQGPASSTNNDVLSWSGTTGSISQDAGGPLPASIASVAHEWLNSFTQSTGAFTQTRPACADLSNASSGCLMSTTAGGDLSGTLPSPTVVKVNGATVPASAALLSSNSSSQLVAAAAATSPVAVSATGAIGITGAAGQVLAGSTPAFTATPSLGTDNSIAGTWQLANGSANAHTIWSSAATTSNTIAGFATAPTTLDLVSCTTSSTTCTLTDAGGPIPSSLANASHKWFNSFTQSTGLFTQTQPALSDLTASFSAPLSLSTNTLSVACAAGQVMAGATPACTATPTLGTTSSVAGSLTIAPNGAASPTTEGQQEWDGSLLLPAYGSNSATFNGTKLQTTVVALGANSVYDCLSSVSVTGCTTAQSSAQNFATSYTIPAAELVSGKLIRVKFYVQTIEATGGTTITFKINVGATNVYTSASNTLATTKSGYYELDLIGTAAAGTGVTVICNGSSMVNGAAGTSSAVSASLTTSGSLVLQPTGQFAAATSTNQIELMAVSAEYL
ncbi:MAG TPA: hypothetical protein VG206_02835 [Terriglobia bacterium]|nr:hypothetical protein [Terriglobia bacterium]